MTPARSDSESLLDDLESGTGRIPGMDGRVGVWYAFNSDDGDTAQVPTPTTPGVPILPELIPSSLTQSAICASKYGMHTTGSGFDWAGIGFDLKFDGSTYGTYDASRFTGISFFGAGTSVSVRVSTISTTSTKYGGTCTLDEVEANPNNGCQPYALDIYLGDDFSQHWVPFGALVAPAGEWHPAPAFEPNLLTNIQFYTSGSFDFWIDDVSFYAGRPGCCEISPPECQGVISFGTALGARIQPVGATCADVCYREVFYDWLSTTPTSEESLDGLQCLISLRQLTAKNYALSKLAPISKLSRLTNVNLGMNQISDLQPLAALFGLSTLDLSDNQIRDLTPISNLRHLTSLTLHSNSLEDLKPLASLTALWNLDLSFNQVRDVGPLADLTDLTNLDLSNNRIQNVAALSKLSKLARLELKQNALTTLSGFGNLPNLPSLDLSDNQIADLGDFGNMAGLTSLTLSRNQITVARFGSLPKLQTLDLSDNQVKDLTGFGNLPELTTLYFANNRIGSLENAGALPKLTTITLSQNQISTVKGIASMSALTTLLLSDNRIDGASDLSELTQLQSLSALQLDGNPLGTLANLPLMSKLTSISLANTGVSDVSLLGKMPGLTWLDLSKNAISDVSALSSLQSITSLDLEGNQIANLEVFLSFNWVPPHSGGRYTIYASLDVRGNPIDCNTQAANIAALEELDVSVYTDCPSGG